MSIGYITQNARDNDDHTGRGDADQLGSMRTTRPRTPSPVHAADHQTAELHAKAADHQTAANPANMTAHQTAKTTAADRANMDRATIWEQIATM